MSSDPSASCCVPSGAAGSAPAAALDLSTPEIVSVTSRPVAQIHFSIPRAEMGSSFGAGCAEIFALLGKQGAMLTEGDAESRAVGAFYQRVTADIFEFDLCVPTSKSITPEGRVTAGMLPPADAPKVATAVLTGDYSALPAAWVRLMEWIAAEKHTSADECAWESYIVGPGDSSDPAQWKTRLSCALK